MEEYKTTNINNVLHGPVLNEKPPQGGLGQFIIKQCDKYADQIMQSCPYENRSMTFGEFKMRSLSLAENMQKTYSIKKGDIVLSCMKNSLENAIPVSATWLLAGFSTTLDPTQSVSDCQHLMNMVKPKLIIVDEDSLPLIEITLKNIHLQVNLIVNENPGTKLKNYALLSDLITMKMPEDFAFVPVEVHDENTLASILFSSGTTGLPKGICQSHKSLYMAAMTFWEIMDNPKCFMYYTTFYWVSGLYMFIMQLSKGAKRIALRQNDPLFNCQVISMHKVESILIATPFSYVFFEMKQYEQEHDCSSLKLVVVGGCPLSEELSQRLFNMCPNILFSSCYGMTEVGTITSYFGELRNVFQYKPASSGTVAAGAILKIIDTETGTKLGPNQRGEIYVKTSEMLLGYYNNTAENPLDHKGFVKTGDIGHYDEDYYVYVYDRSKDMFKYQSWHIVPSSIEAIIKEHPAVDEAVVFGIPHERDGFLPSAAVKLKKNANNEKVSKVTTEDIRLFVAERVSDRQQLRGGVYIVNQIPKTPSGKVQRYKVQEHVMQQIKI